MPTPGEETRDKPTFKDAEVKTFQKLQDMWNLFPTLPVIPEHSAESTASGESGSGSASPKPRAKPPWLTQAPGRTPPRRDAFRHVVFDFDAKKA